MELLQQLFIVYIFITVGVFGFRTARKHGVPEHMKDLGFLSAEYKYNSGVAVFWPLCFVAIIIRDLYTITINYIKSYKEIS